MDALLAFAKAFLVGGALCAIGQILLDKTRMTPARILTAYVVAGAALGAAGLYEPLVKWAGAGASVPLTGFGNVLVQGTRAAIDKLGAAGIATGAFTAGAAGIGAAVVFSLLMALIFRSRDKN